MKKFPTKELIYFYNTILFSSFFSSIFLSVRFLLIGLFELIVIYLDNDGTVGDFANVGIVGDFGAREFIFVK